MTLCSSTLQNQQKWCCFNTTKLHGTLHQTTREGWCTDHRELSCALCVRLSPCRPGLLSQPFSCCRLLEQQLAFGACEAPDDTVVNTF